jgi:hypothetical protein
VFILNITVTQLLSVLTVLIQTWNKLYIYKRRINMEMYQVLRYHKDDIDNHEVVGCNLTRSQAAQLLHDTKVIQGKEMLISEPMPEEGYDE